MLPLTGNRQHQAMFILRYVWYLCHVCADMRNSLMCSAWLGYHSQLHAFQLWTACTGNGLLHQSIYLVQPAPYWQHTQSCQALSCSSLLWSCCRVTLSGCKQPKELSIVNCGIRLDGTHALTISLWQLPRVCLLSNFSSRPRLPIIHVYGQLYHTCMDSCIIYHACACSMGQASHHPGVCGEPLLSG